MLFVIIGPYNKGYNHETEPLAMPNRTEEHIEQANNLYRLSVV
jgi:hypothetical protein